MGLRGILRAFSRAGTNLGIVVRWRVLIFTFIPSRTVAVTPGTLAETRAPHSARAPSAGWVIWELRAETVRAGWRAQTAPLLHGLDGAVALAVAVLATRTISTLQSTAQ